VNLNDRSKAVSTAGYACDVSVRRLTVLCAAFALCLLVAVSVPAATGAAAVDCAPTCGGSAASLQSPAHPAPESCIRDASCGGGVALGLGMLAGVGMLAAAAPVVAPSLLSRRRWAFWTRSLLGRVPTGGLFRPPRLLIDA
jgi:hypothetical protein